MRNYTEKDNIIFLAKWNLVSLFDIVKKRKYCVVESSNFYPSRDHGKCGVKFVCTYKGDEEWKEEQFKVLDTKLKEYCEENNIEYEIIQYRGLNSIGIKLVRLGNSE